MQGARWETNQWVGYVIRDLDGLNNRQALESKGRDQAVL